MKYVRIAILCLIFAGCSHVIHIPKDYDNSTADITHRMFAEFYKAHRLQNTKNINSAEKDIKRKADKVIRARELDKYKYSLDLIADKGNFALANMLAVQINPLYDMAAFLEIYNDEYSYVLSYGEGRKHLRKSNSAQFENNEKANFYLPFRWANNADVIATVANDHAYNQLFLSFVLKYEDAPHIKNFKATPDMPKTIIYDPAWSANDDLLAFTIENIDGSKVMLLDIDKQKLTEFPADNPAHCFRFSSKGGLQAFAVLKKNDSYIPVIYKNRLTPLNYVAFHQLASNCPLIRAAYSKNGDRIAVLQYTSTDRDSIRLSIIDTHDNSLYSSQRKTKYEEKFIYKHQSLSDPIWLYDDNFLLSSTKNECFISFVNSESLQNNYDILMLTPVSGSNITTFISTSYSPKNNTVSFLNELEQYYVYSIKDLNIKKTEKPVLVLTRYWKTEVMEYKENAGKDYQGKVKLSITDDNFIPLSKVNPDQRKMGLVLKRKIGKKYDNVLECNHTPSPGSNYIFQWDNRLTVDEGIKSGVFYLSIKESTEITETKPDF